MTNHDADLIKHIANSKVGVINFCGAGIGINQLELILLALKSRTDGTLTIQSAGLVMSMMELGACLNALAMEPKK